MPYGAGGRFIYESSPGGPGMSTSQGDPPSPSTERPFGPLRAWRRSLMVTELVMAALFAACTLWLTVSSPTESPMITPTVRRVFTWYSVQYSAWVFLGYMIIGLLLGTLMWALLAAWSALHGRPLAARGFTRGVLVLLAAILAYQAVALCVLDPQVMGNILTGVWGVRLIGTIGDWVPAWLVIGLRLAALAAAGLVLAGGAIRALGRARRSARLAAVAALSVVLAAVAGLGLRMAMARAEPPPPQDDRPNILILASDGLQQEHLSLYGYPKPTSPNIDLLGQDSVRFTGCYVPVARTLGSWTSMLTSTWPHTHGWRHTWPREPRIEITLPTLSRELRKKGYTSCVYSDWAGSDFGKVDYGFDVVETAPEAWSLASWIGVATCRAHPLLVSFGDNWLGHRMYPEMKGMPVNPDPRSVTRRAVKALEGFSRSRQPFFMIVFYSETHLPYSTRYPYYRRFADPAYRGNHKVCVYMPDPRLVASGGFDPESFDIEQVRALYDGAILSFDDQVGEVLKTVKKLKLWDDTIVMVTSDHGEDLLESRGSYGHGAAFSGDDYDSRIPLVVSDPAQRGGGPRVVENPVSSIDILPTLLERVGLPSPATCEGESLLGLLQGRPQATRNMIFAETEVLMGGGRELQDDQVLLYPPLLEMMEVSDLASGQVGLKQQYVNLLVEARQRMVRTPKWKLVYVPLKNGARYMLYDVQKDPACLREVKDAHPEVTAELKSKLWNWMERDPLRHRHAEHMVANTSAQ